MNAGPFITHGLLLAAGFAIALAIAGKETTAGKVKATAADMEKKPARAVRSDAAVRPRELLRSMVNMPMESMERYRLKQEIYADWSKQDPLGFLAHFEHRPWFGYMSDDAHPFSILAKTQPEELLAYARRTGCEEAVEKLVVSLEPARVLELVQQDGIVRLPQDLLEKLAEKGEEVDPLFHEKLAAISDPAARKAALMESVSVMKETGRLEDLLKLMEEHADVLDHEDVGKSIGHMLLMDRRELGRLDSLDGEVRKAAVGEIIHSLQDEGVSEQDRRQILTDLAARGDLDARRQEIFEKIVVLDEISPESAGSWKDWALGLPKSERTRPLQLASMVMWALHTRAEAADFEAIPAGELRDGAVVGGVGRYLEAKKLDEAGRMAELIADPNVRGKMKGYLALLAKGEEPDDFDPFGFGEK